MMGRKPQIQRNLFYTKFNLDKRVRDNHILRKIDKYIDFDFSYKEVEYKYGYNGNVSVPPPVILKMMLLLIFYNVRSERELMDTIPERLDWLWFLGYDLDDNIPNHSVLSKARCRWGAEIFKSFFDKIVWQCVETGLVDGSKLFMDSSLVQADASNNSVINKTSLKRYLNKSYIKLESRLEEQNSIDSGLSKNGIENKKYISTTDPDASVTRRGGSSKLKHHIHRGVDGKNEVITATDVTPGSVNEAHRLAFLVDEHKRTTGRTATTVVADSKYGTINNFLECHDRGINGHIPSLEKTGKGSGRQKGIFPKELFVYNADTDTFSCPAGQTLRKRKLIKKRSHYEYKASKKTCNKCELRQQCTKSKQGRTLKRHIRQDKLDFMLKQSESLESQKDIKTRQNLMERSFARAYRYGFKRARWRRLWRVQIQEYLTSAIQNIMILIKNINKPANAMGMVSKRMGNSKRTSDCYCSPRIFNNIHIINWLYGLAKSGYYRSYYLN